jgi:hypothetical protein
MIGFVTSPAPVSFGLQEELADILLQRDTGLHHQQVFRINCPT